MTLPHTYTFSSSKSASEIIKKIESTAEPDRLIRLLNPFYFVKLYYKLHNSQSFYLKRYLYQESATLTFHAQLKTLPTGCQVIGFFEDNSEFWKAWFFTLLIWFAVIILWVLASAFPTSNHWPVWVLAMGLLSVFGYFIYRYNEQNILKNQALLISYLEGITNTSAEIK